MPCWMWALVGYVIRVERSEGRVFDDDEFEVVGATLVPEGSWADAPTDHVIVGLTELPNMDFPPHHAHIQFGHCFKEQENWDHYLSRFERGGGVLYDIEFLTDSSGQRVSAFGYYAGFAGAAIALLAWSYQLRYPTPRPTIDTSSYPSEAALVDAVKNAVSSAIPSNGSRSPQVLVMGALGRCGSGAIDLFLAAGLPSSSILKWDVAETTAGGPFHEVATADVFINCINLSKPISPFITLDSLAQPGRQQSYADLPGLQYFYPTHPPG